MPSKLAPLLVLLALPLLASAAPPPCDASRAPAAFCDITRSPIARARALVATLTMGEKVDQTGAGAHGIDRLGIPPFQWWGEALHGVCESPNVHFRAPTPNATSFPEIIGVASSFDAGLFGAMGIAIGREARAMMNAGNANGTFWAPNINIVKDPRWGRLQETPGECPVLSAAYAALFVGGFQNTTDPTATGAPGSGTAGASSYVQASSCCKHFAAYSEENWHGLDRFHFDAEVTPQEWADTYLPAFQACIVHGHASGLMCSYNAVNGVPACANPHLLTEVARNQLGFDGYITGDCGAAKDVFTAHNFTSTAEEAANLALEAGMDVDCGSFLQSHLLDPDPKTPVNVTAMDEALVHLFATRIRLGLFDATDHDPMGYRKITAHTVDYTAHFALARRASDEGVVLLHRRAAPSSPSAAADSPMAAADLPFGAPSFPLLHPPSSLALLGPNADNAGNMQGVDCHGVPPYLVTPRDAFEARLGAKAVHFTAGSAINKPTSDFAAAVALAGSSAATVLVVGLDPSMEYEMRDRDTLLLPDDQEKLVVAAAAAAAARSPPAPVVVVLMSGGALDVSAMVSNPNITAVLWCGYPGQSGGDSIADIVLGNVAPSGRVPLTWYREAYLYNGHTVGDSAHALSMWDMGLRPNASSTVTLGRTYRYFDGDETTRLFRFGHGLQLHQYDYSDLTVQTAAATTEEKAGGTGTDAAADAAAAAAAAAPTVSANAIGVVLGAPDAQRHSRIDSPAMATASLSVQCTHTPMTRGMKGGTTCPHSVLAFISPPGAGRNGIPLKTLLGFQRVFNLTAASVGTEEEGTATKATKATTVTTATAAPVVVVHFPITAYDLSVVDATGKRVTVVGAWTVGVGVEGSDETTVSATITVA